MAEIKSYPNNVNEEIGAEHVMRWHHGRTSGVYGAAGELAVAQLATPAMAVTVSDGSGWLTDSNGNGIHFWNDVFSASAALLQLPVETADGVLNRIDRVIVEWSTPNYTQLPEIKVLKGTSAVSPVAPALTNSASLRQISLARIAVAAGTLAITAGMITDERFNASVCGVVTETTEVDTSMATAQFDEVLGEAQQLVNDLQGEAVIDHAATHEPGGDDPAKFVFYGGAQSLTDEQKAQARTNMGASASGHTHDPASLGSNGVAELDTNSVVKPGQARAIVQTKTGSFTLGAADAEKLTLLNSSSAINVELPNDSTYSFPVGTAFNFVRWGTGACTFSRQSGVSWKVVNSATSISAQGSAALAVKVAANTWWLSCG
jgi:uncharacterized protein YaiE (UPF0345 family)